MSISKRLFIALFGLTAVVVFLTLGTARWSFERGFLDYTNALEEARLTRLSEELSEAYREEGGWGEGAVASFYASLDRWEAPPGPPAGRLTEEGRGRLHPRMPGHRAPPTALLDLEGVTLAQQGSTFEAEDVVSVWVLVEGERVGELRSQPRRIFNSAQETAFSRQQLHASLLLGVLALCAAALLSWVVAGALLAPVRSLLEGVRKLSSGDYSPRFELERGDELGELLRDVHHLARTLEKNQSDRQRWLANISHELRTPLTILMGEIHAIKDGVRAFDAEQLGSLDAEVQRLHRLVEDLYMLSVTELGGLRYTLEPLELRVFLEELCDVLSARAEVDGLQVELAVEGELWIRADGQRLEQLLVNLFENTRAYSDPPARLVVRAWREGAWVHLSLEDTAPGVSSGEYEVLFEPLFRREASRDRRTGGAGLGLAICRNIVEAHGGVITACPSGFGGLRVEMRFPAQRRVEDA